MIVTKKELRLFFRDRLCASLFMLAALMGVLNALLVIIRVRGNDLQVSLRYSEYTFNHSRGHWAVLYELALFGLVVTVLNGAVAVKTRKLRRAYAIGVLVLTLLVLLITLLVSGALVGLAVNS